MPRKSKARSPSPATSTEDLNEPPTSIDPYEVLTLEKTATQDQIKTAYRKSALKNHPDKVKPEEREEANKKFQEIAFAYLILSDEKRRRRYDTTGSTAESLDVDDDDFNWTEFFREQTAAMVDGAMIEKIKRDYQGSAEEREDVLRVYTEVEGDMDGVYEEIMCSNVLDDDERIRGYIDEAITKGEVEKYNAYAKEGKDKKRRRAEKARSEATEAMELAEELGVKDKLFGGKGTGTGKGKSGSKEDRGEDALKALIQQRQNDRSGSFFDRLEAKYGGGNAGKRRQRAEPPEEMFRSNSKKARSKK